MTRQVKAEAQSATKETSSNRLKAVKAMTEFIRIKLSKGETILDLKSQGRA